MDKNLTEQETKTQAQFQDGEAIALEGRVFPEMAKFLYMTHKGVRLRVLILESLLPHARGTVILVPGRTEFIEKYFETAEDFRSRGFAVLIIDHRGQGLSDRLLEDPLKSWVSSFEDYVDDLAFVMMSLKDQLPRPHVLVGHSMGGCIGLQGLISGHLNPDCAVFNAPMLQVYGIETSPFPDLISFLSMIGLSKRNLPMQVQREGIPVPFSQNKLTSDKERYTKWRAYFDQAPRLRVSGPTYGWMRAAVKSMRYVNRNAKKLQTPTLIVGASLDPDASTPAVKDFAYRAQCEFKLIKGALHETFLETDGLRNEFFESFDAFCVKQAV